MESAPVALIRRLYHFMFRLSALFKKNIRDYCIKPLIEDQALAYTLKSQFYRLRDGDPKITLAAAKICLSPCIPCVQRKGQQMWY